MGWWGWGGVAKGGGKEPVTSHRETGKHEVLLPAWVLGVTLEGGVWGPRLTPRFLVQRQHGEKLV